jgi:hypothetical protein
MYSQSPMKYSPKRLDYQKDVTNNESSRLDSEENPNPNNANPNRNPITNNSPTNNPANLKITPNEKRNSTGRGNSPDGSLNRYQMFNKVSPSNTNNYYSNNNSNSNTNNSSPNKNSNYNSNNDSNNDKVTSLSYGYGENSQYRERKYENSPTGSPNRPNRLGLGLGITHSSSLKLNTNESETSDPDSYPREKLSPTRTIIEKLEKSEKEKREKTEMVIKIADLEKRLHDTIMALSG